MDFQFASDYPGLILLTTVIGFSILVMGRQILWVFIAGLGFALGLFLSSQYYNAQFEWQVFFISTVVAALGALLAITVQRFAAGIAGFATGWLLSIVLLGYFNLNLGQIESLIPYIVGIISGVLLIVFFDWGVIVASSLAGSAIVVSGMTLSQNTELLLLIMFALIGMAIQEIWFIQDK
jgi:hypothetical protein